MYLKKLKVTKANVIGCNVLAEGTKENKWERGIAEEGGNVCTN